MSEGFLETSFGRVHYVRRGTGQSLVLLHSNGNSVYEWDEVIDELASTFDVLAIDQPGQGDSDPLTRHLSIDDYSDCVVEVMDALDVQRAAVAGTSIGGFFVVSLTARYPDRFSHGVVIEANFRDPDWWADQDNWNRVEANFGIPTQDRAKVEARVNHVSDEFLTRWTVDRNKAGARSMMSTMWAIRDYDMAGECAKVTVPTLLLFGTKGPCFSARKEFEAAIPGCEVAVLEDSGHFPMFDEPQLFITTLTEFCREKETADG